MVLDINLFRAEKGGTPDLIRASEKKRGNDGSNVDKVIELDEVWRKCKPKKYFVKIQKGQFNCEEKRAEWNKCKAAIGKKKKESKGQDPCEEEIKCKDALELDMEALTDVAKAAENNRDKALFGIGNLVHETVPDFQDEENNEEVEKWGDEFVVTMETHKYHHHELLSMIGGYDPKRGAKVAGHRGYFLTGPGMMLNMALYNYALSFLVGGNGYLPIQPPFFLKSDIMAETCQLDDFDENLYRVDSGKGPKTDDKKAGKADLLIQEKKVPTDEPQHEDDDKFLIATSEQPLSAYYRGEYLAPDQLPVRFAGFSTCFRKEAGSHGKDCWGLYRVHQFEKVEQFLVTHPDESWAEFTKMMNISKEFYKSLQLPYRVVNIVSGALNDAAAKKQDLEAWFPGYNEYRELVSCSNCTDYQSRNLEVRLRAQKVKGQPESKAYVHMLNGTLCATGRTLCCLLENYQTPEGIRVPEPLQPYMGGQTLIPFVNKPPKKEDL